ncbi:exosome non-catalytic core subunit rrp40 [Coelomomyces lativittatus]|nr:exosome non-catalytic core subunit rrp40 [Coelomomyces lativittatus]KAJ1502133.1 exosome non-catalytic core subunit rrp40 [Coelomomyces lativittatus]
MNLPSFVLPGDTIPCFDMAGNPPTTSTHSNQKVKTLKLGPGLLKEKNEVIAVKAGKLRFKKDTNAWWIESDQKRYVPSVSENVIGVITHKLSEAYKVDIGSAHIGILPFLAFEGASKRNRVNLTVGDVIYARVSVANKDMDPELECINPATNKSDGYGELKNGYMFKCSLGLCRSLMNPSNQVLKALEKEVVFEMAVGMNGRVWICAEDVGSTLSISHILQETYRLKNKGETRSRDVIGTRGFSLKIGGIPWNKRG